VFYIGHLCPVFLFRPFFPCPRAAILDFSYRLARKLIFLMRFLPDDFPPVLSILFSVALFGGKPLPFLSPTAVGFYIPLPVALSLFPWLR